MRIWASEGATRHHSLLELFHQWNAQVDAPSHSLKDSNVNPKVETMEG